MAFSRPTLETIIDRIKSDFLSRIEGATTLLRRSILIVIAKVFGAQHHMQYGYLEDAKKQLFLSQSDSQYLEVQANEYGVSRKDAVKATGNATVTGTSGLEVPAGRELELNGVNYTVDASVTLSGGTGTISVTASEGGTDGNQDSGASLSFVSPIAGISSTATVDSDGLTGGLEEETDTALKNRALERKRRAPHGGAEFDYENWALEYSGVTRAWAISEYYGLGTIGLAFVRDDDDSIIPDSDERAAVKSYIQDHTDPFTGARIGKPLPANLIMISLSLESLDFTIKLTPNTSAVQTSVQSKIEDVIKELGGPGETIELSKISAAISSATGEDAHKITSPTEDISSSTSTVPVLGTITFQDY